MKATTWGKKSKRSRATLSSAGSGGEAESPSRKRPKGSSFFPDMGPSNHPSVPSEDNEKDKKFGRDLMSISRDVESLQSREKKFYLEWRGRLEEFHQCQQDLYDGLKKKIGDIERGWSEERIDRYERELKKAKQVVRELEGPIGKDKYLIAPTTWKSSSSSSTTKSKSSGLVQRILDDSDLESEPSLKEEEYKPHLLQPTTQGEGKGQTRWTPNSPTPASNNDQSDAYEDENILEISSNNESSQEGEFKSTRLLNDDCVFEGTESGPGSYKVEMENKQEQLRSPSGTVSSGQDREGSSVGRTNKQPHAATTLPQSTTPRPRRSRPDVDYAKPLVIYGDDEPIPLPKDPEEDEDFDPDHVTPPKKRAKGKPSTHGSHNMNPAKGSTRKSESTVRGASIGTPGGPKFGTAQQKLQHFFPSKGPVKKEKESGIHQTTPTPIRDRPKSPKIDQNKLETRAISQPTYSPSPIRGVPSHLNKRRSPFKEDMRNDIRDSPRVGNDALSIP